MTRSAAARSTTLRYFTEDAIVTAGPDCTHALPCVGKAAIRQRYLALLMARKLGPPLTDQRSDGKDLRTHGEVSHMLGPDGSVTTLKGEHTFQFKNGRISSLSHTLDPGDDTTARYLADTAAQGRLARREP